MELLPLFLISSVIAVSGFKLSFDLPKATRWFVPDSHFNFTWITKETVLNELSSLLHKNNLVNFHLYTQLNPKDSQELQVGNTTNLTKSNFNGKLPTRIIIHGFATTYKSDVCTSVRDAFLETEPNNVICVDWGSIATRSYPTARFSVPSVGNYVGIFIDFLHSKGGMSLKNLTIIGHSLGAHIAGFAGKSLKNDQKVDRIIGCDPASPLFSYIHCSSRLCPSDAEDVETIQTCGGRLGFSKAIGKLAFYPNGGIAQPGCDLDITGSCSHSRSYLYYAEAIRKNDFPSKKCISSAAAILHACGKSYSGLKMGSPSNKGHSGIYYVPINDSPNYGME